MKTKIAITVETEMLGEIDRLAEYLGLTRSQFIENLLAVGLGDAKVLKAAGLFDMARMVIQVKGKMNKRLAQLKKIKGWSGKEGRLLSTEVESKD